jgi:hypothetical protein
MNSERLIREERKADIILVSEDVNLKRCITCADPYDFNPVLEIRSFNNQFVKLINIRRLSLAVRTVHAENFEYYQVGLYLRYPE